MKIATCAAAATLLAAFAAASAPARGGPSPGQLMDAGWSCFVPPGEVMHCSPPGARAVPGSGAPSLTLRVFDTSDPNARDAAFVGTEHLIRADLYRGQPCPRDPGPDGGYWPLPFGYLFCHHFAH